MCIYTNALLKEERMPRPAKTSIPNKIKQLNTQNSKLKR